MYKYNLLTFSGTFDRLHKGHQGMFHEAFRLSKTVLIGITSDEFIKNKAYSHAILPYQQRKKELTDYLSSHQWEKRSRIFILNDPYGSGPINNNLEAILVTRETLPNALVINKRRKENGLTPINVEVRKLIKGDDHTPIRSEQIRSGNIDRYGFSYSAFFKKLTSEYGIFFFPKELYPSLRKPLGIVIAGKTFEETTKKVKSYLLSLDSYLLITIGDVISDTLINEGIIPNVYIIDYKTERKRIKAKERDGRLSEYTNLAGTLSQKACKAVEKAIRKFSLSQNPIIVPIRGEEDLLAIPAILFAPLGSLVLYGQRGIGVVVVKVDEDIKKKIMNIISNSHMSF